MRSCLFQGVSRGPEGSKPPLRPAKELRAASFDGANLRDVPPPSRTYCSVVCRCRHHLAESESIILAYNTICKKLFLDTIRRTYVDGRVKFREVRCQSRVNPAPFGAS